MSDATLYQNRLGIRRGLTVAEKTLIQRLIELAGDRGKSFHTESLEVQEMSDGGMGSLYIVSLQKEAQQRRFGGCIAELEYKDTDGVAILASLNVDQDGDLFELDVWKTNFSPTIRLAPL